MKYELLPPLTTSEFEALKADIEQNGLLHPIIVDENGDILDGHHRSRIVADYKPVVMTGMTESQKKAFVYKMNLARRNLSPTQKKEASKKQRAIAFDLASEGMTQEQIASLMGVARKTISNWINMNIGKDANVHIPDARVKIPKAEHEIIYARLDSGDTQEQVAADYGVVQSAISKIITKVGKQIQSELAINAIDELQGEEAHEIKTVNVGEWWSLGGHVLYCGDTSTDEFVKKIGDAALAFADPPYGVNKAGWDNKFYWEHDYLIDKAKVVAVTPGIVSIFDFAKLTTMPYKWSIACWIENGMTRGAMGYGNWIYVALFTNETVYAQSQDIIRVTIKNNETEITTHESRKPSELLVKLIQYYTEENDFVIDPFLGSGTTLFACEEMNRLCVGGELKPDYCSEIIARWEKQTGRDAVKIK